MTIFSQAICYCQKGPLRLLGVEGIQPKGQSNKNKIEFFLTEKLSF